MVTRIKKIIKGNKKIFENFSYLALVQVFNLMMPLLVYPYLIRVLGDTLYGKIVFAQTVATYFSIFINFGFNVSGAKDVAIHRDNAYKIKEIVSSILIIKIAFWFLSLFVLILGLLLFNVKGNDFWLYVFSFFICLNEVLFPQWFFQGIEKMKYITIINFCLKVLFFVLIFVFVTGNEDFLLVPLLNSVGVFTGGMISLYVIFQKEKVMFGFPSFNIIRTHLKDNINLFISDVVISVKDRFNILFVGIFLGMDMVAIYDLGIKILLLVMLPISILNNALYPKMAIEKDKKLLSKIMKYSFIFYILVTTVLEFLVPQIVYFLGGDNLMNAVTPTRIFLLSAVVYSLGFPLAHNGLLVFNKYKLLLIGMVLTTLFYLFCILIGYTFSLLENVSIFAIITVLVYTFEFIYRYIVCKRENIVVNRTF
ncbi:MULTISPECIES: oligosaccharide flippase family protein [Capnocytophaga]|uniref:Flippase n=1 Tax=Capnocytophaga canimorsus TaxID=28188 RepID=A0A250G576_9FLAO|nr:MULTISPECIES: oligosaccharide flippase family protein [Capnocytophaga]ATA91915.1 flippase [Capnocytophaga canimorsus]